MKKKIFILYVLLFAGWLAAGEAVMLPGHKEPTQIEVCPASKHLYIVEFPTIYIYSLEDFKLVKKFGEKGDGPGRFNRRRDIFPGIEIDVRAGEILVKTNMGKIALFKDSGKLMWETKPDFASALKFHGEKFIGMKNKEEKSIIYWRLCLFNSKSDEGKEIHRTPDWMQHIFGPFELRLLNGTFPHIVSTDNKIFYSAGEWNFDVRVFDPEGEPLFVIHRDYERLRFSKAYKKTVVDLLRAWFKDPIFEQVKRVLQFPVYLPAVRDFYGDGRTLYIRTFLEEKGKSEFFIYRTDGEFVRRVMLPIPPGSFTHSFPTFQARFLFTIKDGKLYGLYKNEKSKEYELRISPVDSY